MRTSDLFKLSLLNLSRRKSRTFLTVLGVIVGTACIVLMLSIGYSNYKQFSDMLTDNASLTQIQINDYSSSTSGRGGITDSTVQSIAAMEHVRAASPVIQIPVTIYSGIYEANAQVTGIDRTVLDLDFAKGEMFAEGGAMPVLVVGGDAVQQFVDPKNPPNYADYEEYSKYEPEIDWLGTELEMQFGYNMEDTGNAEIPTGSIYRASASGVTKKKQNQESNSIYMDLSIAKRMLMDNRELADYMGIPVNTYQQVIVRVDDMDNVQSVMDEIKKLGYETYSETEYISQMQEEQSRQQGQLFAIGLISLFVSAIGIANTMYASILERRRDIGIMKVVGMKIKKIRQLFLTESAVIGLLGGLIGLAVSYIVVLAINTGTEQTSFLGMYFSEGMKIEIPAWVALGAIGIAVLVGIISGVYPARKATKMSPLEAMRSGN
ncbi:ABC transporter permease [Christensenella hongkongensis]|uniref:Cell division protein FtsX n=1 Tax=Christensenella hongkongensis TaxID=270498 RepID=A0A0M2NKD2_9FIRM|nr:ABC transporter permease [Christensenella hongkongensis]KKI50912.1 Cell division protein FtsX [Christensenella hongkongensis]TCW30654.1 ABC-type lipoprotein release transport system permease subunit [Christensenella hongkongensis]